MDEDNRGFENFFAAETLIVFRPYGVNKMNGKLVESGEEADSLEKNLNLVGGTGGEVDYIRWPALIYSAFTFPAYTSSYLSNTQCYETNKNNNVAKNLLNLINLSCKKNFQREKVII